MNITRNSVVNFHYRLYSIEGGELESSHQGDPVAYLHGHGGIMPGLEEAMEGRIVGETFTVDVPARKAYGVRKEDAQQRVPIKHLMTKGKLKKGMTVTINTSEGPRDVTILKVGKFNVDIDANHPFAGMDLRFDIELKDVREATQDEIAHGHAHGVGGHQH